MSDTDLVVALRERIHRRMDKGWRRVTFEGAELDVVLHALTASKKIAEAAAFLDGMASRLWPLTAHDRYAALEQAAADCRAMAERLRKS